MATNLLDVARSFLTPELVERAGAVVGESPGTTRSVLEGAVPTLLAGFMRCGESEGGPTRLLGLVNQYAGRDVGDLPGLLAGAGASQSLSNTGRNVLGTLFGARQNAVVDVVTSQTGVKPSSASPLFGLAASLVLGMLGRAKSAQGLDGNGLVRLLAGQRDAIAHAAPPGLANALGADATLPFDVRSERGTSRDYQTARDRVTSGMRETYDGLAARSQTADDRMRRGIPLVVVAAALLGGLWYLMRGRVPERLTQATPPLTGEETAGVRPLAAVALPNGDTLRVEQGSVVHNVATYLGSSDATVPKRFEVGPHAFEPGSTGPTGESAHTVDGLSAVLNAYPTARVRLEGHNDQELKDALAARGVEPNRILPGGPGQTSAGGLEVVVVQK
jgi:hypothetical protein